MIGNGPHGIGARVATVYLQDLTREEIGRG